MFLALRELRFARGRFTLMGIVIALIAVLVVLLSGLSSGLVNDGVSGLKSMPATAFAFDKGTITDNAFSRSLVDKKQLSSWQDADGVAEAEPMGVSIVNGVTDADKQVDLTLFGVDPGGVLAPAVSSGTQLAGPAGIVCPRREGCWAEARHDGEARPLGRGADRHRLHQGQATFGHVDVAYLPIGTWQLIASNTAPAGAPTRQRSTRSRTTIRASSPSRRKTASPPTSPRSTRRPAP